MSIAQEPVFHWLSQYAYQPNMIYFCMFLVMIASGFGLPIPEEVTIVSVGVLAFMGGHPDQFPPPYPGAPVVRGYEAAVVAFLAVVFTDCLVFSLGRIFGRKILNMPRTKAVFTEERLAKINSWVKRHGMYAVFVFRFTAGLRFPAHIILGMSKIRAWQFILVDSLAASISIPTQILLIYHFGEPILHILHEFKLWVLGLIVVGVVYVTLKVFVIPRFCRNKPG